MNLSCALRGTVRRPLNTTSKFSHSTRHASSSHAPADASKANSYRERLVQRIHSKVPLFLHPYTRKLVNAPAAHLTSFLILHEITAVVPLVGLAGFFHYSNWLPQSISEWKWASDGVAKFGNWFKKKGWLAKVQRDEEGKIQGDYWARMGDARFRVVLEWVTPLRKQDQKEKYANKMDRLATAYAITKVLLPVRLGLCFYATPWFARTFIEPVKLGVRGIFGKRKA